MPASIVADGYTLPGRIPGLANTYPTLRFRYRPALPDAAYDYYEKRRGAEGGKAVRDAVVAFLDKHLVDWDAKDRQTGNALPLTPESLRTLHYPVLERLVDHVLSFLPALEEDEKN